MMKKLSLIVTIFLVYCFSFYTTSVNAKSIELKLGHLLNAKGPQNIGAEKFAELVRTKTGDSVEVKVFPSSQLGSGPSMLNGLKLGSVDIFVGAVAWGEIWVKDFGVFGLLNTFRSQEHFLKVLNSDVGRQLMDKLIDEQGIRIVNYDWYRPPRQIFSKRPIKTTEDLAGLKIRVPENKVWLRSWKAAGANPTPIAWGEVFTSLQQGVIEAMEGPITLVYPMKFHEIAKYSTLTNHTRMYVVFFMSDKRFQKLPANVQKAIKEAAQEAGKLVNELEKKAEVENMKAMKAIGVEFFEAPKDFFSKAAAIPQELEKEGVLSKGLFEKIQAIGK